MRVQSSELKVQSSSSPVSVPVSLLGLFVATLTRSPFVASIDRIAAIVNVTSNFLLTRLAEPGSTLAVALDEARRVGFVKADCTRDVEGLDAADKLVVLASLFGWGELSRNDLEVDGIGALTTDDLVAAGEIGGVIKPLVFAVRGSNGVEAFVGPALLSNREPLATLDGALNGIRLDGKHISNLFFSGPGGGLEETAAGGGDFREARVSAPATSWFVRVTFRGVVPSEDSVRALVGRVGLEVEQVVRGSKGASRWLTLGSHSRPEIEAALGRLRSTHRIESLAIRRISSGPRANCTEFRPITPSHGSIRGPA